MVSDAGRTGPSVASLLSGSILDGPAPTGTVALALEDAARMLGAYQWVEQRLFEVLGEWVGVEGDPVARLLFDSASQEHGWHAQLFGEHLPRLDHVEPALLIVPPSAEVDGLLLSLGEAGGTLHRLVALGRVMLPRLVAGYGRHLEHAVAVTDAPVIRALRLVLRDDIEAWQIVEGLIQALVRGPNDVAVVTAYQQQLEQMVAANGVGLVRWPDHDAGLGSDSASP